MSVNQLTLRGSPSIPSRKSEHLPSQLCFESLAVTSCFQRGAGANAKNLLFVKQSKFQTRKAPPSAHQVEDPQARAGCSIHRRRCDEDLVDQTPSSGVDGALVNYRVGCIRPSTPAWMNIYLPITAQWLVCWSPLGFDGPVFRQSSSTGRGCLACCLTSRVCCLPCQ